MKNFVLGLFALVSLMGFNAYGSDAMAQTQTKTAETAEQALVRLFKEEAAAKNSSLSKYLSVLRAENQNSEIENTISESDIIRLESGRSGTNYSVNYLIVVRANYKSGGFVAGYLSAYTMFNLEEDGPATLEIIGPVNVTIN